MGLKANGTPAVLAELGYQLYEYHENGLVRLETSEPGEGNFLALHRSKAARI
jgi:hypothetical protein